MQLVKLFYSVLAILAMQSAYAGPTASVHHRHADRSHSHPLPAQGVAHRHGNGAIGTTKLDEKIVRHKNTIIYGTPKNAPKPAKKEGFKYNQQGERVFSENDPVYLPPKKSSQAQRYSRSSYQTAASFTKGDSRCRYGEADCNVCAVNVQQQFKMAAAQRIRWSRSRWNFKWPQRYPPQNKSPMDIFDGNPKFAGIPDGHIQGFVKTNSRLYPYAGSHSHKKHGGVFVVKRGSQGNNYLASLHQTKSRHPSGVHTIGNYVAYGFNNNSIHFRDINSPNQSRVVSLPMPNTNFGGGLGIVRLSRDNHLIITTGPGGQDNRPRYNRFYHLKSINGVPSSIRFLNQSTTNKPAQWPSGFKFSENMSLITECGTGDIYAIHTSGDEKGLSALTGNGYWRLSKLVSRQNILGLTAINGFTKRQNIKSCYARAAATVHVNPQNRLEFLCHAYAKDPDGSLFNVLGKPSRNADKFYFTQGTVY